jgi:hypothetical protein
MKEEHHFYCVHCLLEGIAEPATVYLYNAADGLFLPVCDQHYEIHAHTPIEMIFDLN